MDGYGDPLAPGQVTEPDSYPVERPLTGPAWRPAALLDVGAQLTLDDGVGVAAAPARTYRYNGSTVELPLDDERFPERRRMLGRCRSCKRPHSTLMPAVRRERTEHRYGREIRRTWLEGRAVAVDGDHPGLESPHALFCACDTPDCDGRVALEPVRGTVKADHPCDPRCTGARGHDCECSCGGENHGADWQAVA